MENNTNLNTDWNISAEELTSWAQLRDDNQPALTGSPKWRSYLAFLENMLLEYGVVAIFKNRWPFERWYTSDDATTWSLVSAWRAFWVFIGQRPTVSNAGVVIMRFVKSGQ